MTRELKSTNELLHHVAIAVRSNPDFNEVRPIGIYVLQQPDATGCNWEVVHWQGPPELCLEAARTMAPVIRQLQTDYNAA